MSPIQQPVSGPALLFDITEELQVGAFDAGIVHGVHSAQGAVFLLTVSLASGK